MKKLILICAVFLVVSASAENVILIRDATILTISHGKIEHGSVLIRGTKIAAVGLSDQITAPTDAQVINASGKFVMPGIVDTHSHTAIEGSVNEISLNVAERKLVHVKLTVDSVSSTVEVSASTEIVQSEDARWDR